MSAELILTRGIQASGKTTWALKWVAEDEEHRARVNRDEIRMTLFGRYWPVPEDAVTIAQHAAIKALLASGRSVVVDDTNLRARNVRALQELAGSHRVSLQDFPITLQEAVERDKIREMRGERFVTERVIRDFYQRYTRKGELPEAPLHYDALPKRYVPDEHLPMAWIFDIDGTLASMNGRGPFEWHRVGEDKVITAVATLMTRLEETDMLICVSGRDEVCRGETEKWLRLNALYPDALFMRPEGDNRDDRIVKEEIFWNDIAPNWNVLGVFDDRDKVVAMWRSLGLQCFQVAEGNF